jgi:uncharacterized protein
MSQGSCLLNLRGEELQLHPNRAVVWPRRKMVIVADTHFGKSSYFGRHGIPVPAGSDHEDRDRLTRLVVECGAEQLIVLGDFLHAPISADSREARDLDAWAQALAPVRVTVIAGNHDRGTPRLAASIEWREGELHEPPFRMIHEATDENSDNTFSLSGHVHPVMRLQSAGKLRLRIPVFWQRASGLILPSFGAFTGGFAVRPAPGEQLFAAGPTAVTRMRTVAASR